MAYIAAGWVVFLFFIWFPVEQAHAAFCFNNYDLGIYGQALALLSLENLNPYLSTRDIRLFNDHFDPILFFVAPLTKFVEPGILAIRVEMFSILLASAAPIWLWGKRIISDFEMTVVFFMILFSPMTLMAVLYPSHPGTWAVAPLSWMMVLLLAEKYRLAMIMLVLLMGCKEEFPVLGGVLGGLLILQRRKRAGLSFFAISVTWFFAVFFLRPIILGRSDYYTTAIMTASGLTMGGSGSWFVHLLELLVWVFAPALLLHPYTKLDFNALKDKLWTMNYVLLAIVLIFIRLVGGYWGNHRAAPLAVMAALMLIGVDGRRSGARGFRKELFCVFLVGTAAPFLEMGSRVWWDKPFKKHCPSTPGRIEALNDVVNYLEGVKADRVLAGGNIVPHLVRRPGIAQVGATKSNNFRFFVIETHEYRNAWPLSREDMKRVENEWRHRPDVKVLRDDNHVLLLESAL